MYCQNCGNESRDGARFCTICGSPLIAPAPTDNNYLPNEPISPQPAPVMPTVQISKKEYFESKCSPKAKKLMKASKTVWLVCFILSLLVCVGYFAFGLTSDNLVKDDGKTHISYTNDDGETFEEDVQTREEKSYGINEILDSPFSATVIPLLVAGIAIVAISLIILFYTGRSACQSQSVGKSIVYLIVAILAYSLGKIVDIAGAICTLIFNIMLTREYKEYIKNEANTINY